LKDILDLNNFIENVLVAHKVPGAEVTLIYKGKIILSSPYGFKNSITKEKLIENTVFEAASLTKPIITYAALQLCDEAVLNLDKPLYKYLDKSYLKNQPLYELITLRQVLSHSSGFPNHAEKNELKVLFKPGEKFTYSGEGFMYLQHVIEHLTDLSLDQYIDNKIFKPLNMINSSLIWKDCFEKQVSYCHDKRGSSPQIRRDSIPRAKGSLLTTTNDYAKFLFDLFEVFNNDETFVRNMFYPEIIVNDYISWSLGWGVVPSKNYNSYWHWGDNNCYKAFTLFSPEDKSGVIIFTNGYNGLSVCKEIVYYIYGEYFAFSKLLDEWYKDENL